jgi:ABC-type bacteriocin/lantibiotic exporter with double-glycine peptidase domain
LLDDPLSALDVNVASFVMREGIIGYLNNKTRIIFSGSIDHLQRVDRIYYIEGGQIKDVGNYQTIKK